MKKLRLEIDELAIESFETLAKEPGRYRALDGARRAAARIAEMRVLVAARSYDA